MGLNYRHHADDLEVQQPKGAPGSYLGPNSTVIGYRISTVINGRTISSNTVSAMMCDPHWLVGHFSGSMVLEAGSVIATGTPGAGVIQDGDVVEALVEGVGMLRNRVRQAAPLAG
ncbi:fumarylacetoacetate hydrolase family protein [Streptomyces inhibens]|uniref:fumarylacetoacetate hydrolase family protein n=1 Tax=Streptomyces inhibens TaxID=2293571 RepID=UPI001EE6ED37|nr:fumarylacetoacetate hydrolase family protein [Streptomyces inhibens]UKY48178.1 fumarylacetoacetate hydrolase family protein [Streptomyces inhibens]